MISTQILYFKDFRYYKRARNRGHFHIIQNGSSNFNDGYSCRETFHYSFNSQTRIGWSQAKVSVRKIGSFFNKISEILGIKNELVIYKTNIKDALVIELGGFWNANPTRQQLFSLFLRSSSYTGTFSICLYSYPLTRRIRPVIKHFLKGNINPTYTGWKDENGRNCNGIVSKFHKATPEFIEKSLVK